MKYHSLFRNMIFKNKRYAVYTLHMLKTVLFNVYIKDAFRGKYQIGMTILVNIECMLHELVLYSFLIEAMRVRITL